MHPRILAQREAEASSRTVVAATKLAERFGLHEKAAALQAQEKQPEIQQMVRNEGVADFLETLVDVVAEHSDRNAEQAIGQRLKDAAAQGADAFLAVLADLPGIGPKALDGFKALFAQPAPTGGAPTPLDAPPDAVGPVTVETVQTVQPADTEVSNADAKE